ncbi:MAG: hypothetical protein ACI88C_000733 [Acidimicrobiales bacterium]|jgi:hypothetical protein
MKRGYSYQQAASAIRTNWHDSAGLVDDDEVRSSGQAGTVALPDDEGPDEKASARSDRSRRVALAPGVALGSPADPGWLP